MSILQLLPIILSAIVLGAHYLRSGPFILVLLSFLFPALLFIKRAWAARLVQFILVLGMFEWLRTLLNLVAERRLLGEPWGRLAIILGLVAIITGGSALLFSYNSSVKNNYRLEKDNEPND
jgi:hypothetical protein